MKIICATDFSESANHATRLAGKLARRLGDDLLLVHILRNPALEEPDDGFDVSGVFQSTQEGHEQRLKYHASLLPPGVKVTTMLLQGNPAERLATLCNAADDARLVVIGEHIPAEASQRLFPTAVTRHMLAACNLPILTVNGAFAQFERWLDGDHRLQAVVAIDRDSSSRELLSWLSAWRKAIPTDVTLLHLYYYAELCAYFGEQPLRSLLGELKRNLSTYLGPVVGKGKITWKLQPALIEIGQHVAEYADGTDLLILGSHQNGGLTRILAGSVATEAVRWAAVPTLLVPRNACAAMQEAREDNILACK